ncbi:WD repeat-containing protein 3 [Galdieria sulphuraria]|nr:WD repeat-containing protein 3 [Galdieria sulphuraria]
MVKAYYKFSPYSLWGVVASRRVPSVTIDKEMASRFFQVNSVVVATAAVNLINLWNIRKIEKVAQLGNLLDEEISSLHYAIGSSWILAGYNNGRIRVFSLETRKLEVLIHSHTSPTTTIVVDESGFQLASGSGAGDIVLWDLSAEKGICRLRGHTNEVTKLKFCYFHSKQYLVSISKDSLLKIWDLVGYSCVQTVVSTRGELWDFCIIPKLNILVIAASQPELEVFGILKPETRSLFTRQENDLEEESHFIVTLGNISLKSSKCTALCVDEAGCHLIVYGNDKSLQAFQLRNWEHAIRHLKRRRKRHPETSSGTLDLVEHTALSTLQAVDFLIYRQTLQVPHRIRSIHLLHSISEQQKHSEGFHQSIVMQFADNGLSLYDLLYEKESDEVFTLRQVANLDIHGHRGDVRSLTFSRQQNYLLSVASSCTGKIWQVSNNLCLRTLSLSGYGTCCLFVCNDIFTVIGTKNGTLEIHCTLTGDSVLQLADHEGPIWSVCESSDEKYLFTGGSDKKIHIYEMVICSTTSGTIPTIQLEPIRTLEMSDEVLCLKTTPDGKLLIVALLDCTVRSFYLDSLRFYLSFYGHKMPVLSMDVTSDSYLLITGSADKSIKIWGLDFGDLHKSLLGHENAVMNITCQPNTHYFFSASRDGLIKYWDADVFQLLMNLKGHSGEVWTLAISSNGEILASAGHDKSIRQWRRTNEQLFLEEEEEARMDEALANSVIQERRRSVSNLEASVHHITLGMESIPEVVSATTLNHMDVVEN